MRIIVVGCGSIGRRHIKNLKDLGHTVLGVDLNDEYRKTVEKTLDIKTYKRLSDVLMRERIDCGFVCTPPNSHIKIAQMLLSYGINVFIEKPISSDFVGLQKLHATAKRKRLKIAVGYNLRFSKSLILLKGIIYSSIIGKILYSRICVGQYLPDWRPWQNYKESYSGKKNMGGGIILDGSHEIEYATWLFGTPISINATAKKLSSLEIDTEDIANISIEFNSGVFVNITMDFIRRDKTRVCEIIGEDGTIIMDFNKSIRIFESSSQKWTEIDVTEDLNEMYVREAKDFIESVKRNKSPEVPFDVGEKVLELVIKSKESSKLGKRLII